MPKISNNKVKIYHKDITKEYDVVVSYNQANKFYAKIDSNFNELLNHLSNKTMNDMNIIPEYEKKQDHYNGIKPNSYLVCGGSEVECLDIMKKALEYLVDKSIEQRKVIIVFYNQANKTQYNSHKFNPEHQIFGFEFALTYAIETTVGDKKVYSIYT